MRPSSIPGVVLRGSIHKKKDLPRNDMNRALHLVSTQTLADCSMVKPACPSRPKTTISQVFPDLASDKKTPACYSETTLNRNFHRKAKPSSKTKPLNNGSQITQTTTLERTDGDSIYNAIWASKRRFSLSNGILFCSTQNKEKQTKAVIHEWPQDLLSNWGNSLKLSFEDCSKRNLTAESVMKGFQSEKSIKDKNDIKPHKKERIVMKNVRKSKNKRSLSKQINSVEKKSIDHFARKSLENVNFSQKINSAKCVKPAVSFRFKPNKGRYLRKSETNLVVNSQKNKKVPLTKLKTAEDILSPANLTIKEKKDDLTKIDLSISKKRQVVNLGASDVSHIIVLNDSKETNPSDLKLSQVPVKQQEKVIEKSSGPSSKSSLIKNSKGLRVDISVLPKDKNHSKICSPILNKPESSLEMSTEKQSSPFNLESASILNNGQSNSAPPDDTFIPISDDILIKSVPTQKVSHLGLDVKKELDLVVEIMEKKSDNTGQSAGVFSASARKRNVTREIDKSGLEMKRSGIKMHQDVPDSNRNTVDVKPMFEPQVDCSTVLEGPSEAPCQSPPLHNINKDVSLSKPISNVKAHSTQKAKVEDKKVPLKDKPENLEAAAPIKLLTNLSSPVLDDVKTTASQQKTSLCKNQSLVSRQAKSNVETENEKLTLHRDHEFGRSREKPSAFLPSTYLKPISSQLDQLQLVLSNEIEKAKDIKAATVDDLSNSLGSFESSVVPESVEILSTTEQSMKEFLNTNVYCFPNFENGVFIPEIGACFTEIKEEKISTCPIDVNKTTPTTARNCSGDKVILKPNIHSPKSIPQIKEETRQFSKVNKVLPSTLKTASTEAASDHLKNINKETNKKAIPNEALIRNEERLNTLQNNNTKSTTLMKGTAELDKRVNVKTASRETVIYQYEASRLLMGVENQQIKAFPEKALSTFLTDDKTVAAERKPCHCRINCSGNNDLPKTSYPSVKTSASSTSKGESSAFFKEKNISNNTPLNNENKMVYLNEEKSAEKTDNFLLKPFDFFVHSSKPIDETFVVSSRNKSNTKNTYKPTSDKLSTILKQDSDFVKTSEDRNCGSHAVNSGELVNKISCFSAANESCKNVAKTSIKDATTNPEVTLYSATSGPHSRSNPEMTALMIVPPSSLCLLKNESRSSKSSVDLIPVSKSNQNDKPVKPPVVQERAEQETSEKSSLDERETARRETPFECNLSIAPEHAFNANNSECPTTSFLMVESPAFNNLPTLYVKPLSHLEKLVPIELSHDNSSNKNQEVGPTFENKIALNFNEIKSKNSQTLDKEKQCSSIIEWPLGLNSSKFIDTSGSSPQSFPIVNSSKSKSGYCEFPANNTNNQFFMSSSVNKDESEDVSKSLEACTDSSLKHDNSLKSLPLNSLEIESDKYPKNNSLTKGFNREKCSSPLSQNRLKRQKIPPRKTMEYIDSVMSSWSQASDEKTEGISCNTSLSNPYHRFLDMASSDYCIESEENDCSKSYHDLISQILENNINLKSMPVNYEKTNKSKKREDIGSMSDSRLNRGGQVNPPTSTKALKKDFVHNYDKQKVKNERLLTTDNKNSAFRTSPTRAPDSPNMRTSDPPNLTLLSADHLNDVAQANVKSSRTVKGTSHCQDSNPSNKPFQFSFTRPVQFKKSTLNKKPATKSLRSQQAFIDAGTLDNKNPLSSSFAASLSNKFAPAHFTKKTIKPPNDNINKLDKSSVASPNLLQHSDENAFPLSEKSLQVKESFCVVDFESPKLLNEIPAVKKELQENRALNCGEIFSTVEETKDKDSSFFEDNFPFKIDWDDNSMTEVICKNDSCGCSNILGRTSSLYRRQSITSDSTPKHFSIETYKGELSDSLYDPFFKPTKEHSSLCDDKNKVKNATDLNLVDKTNRTFDSISASKIPISSEFSSVDQTKFMIKRCLDDLYSEKACENIFPNEEALSALEKRMSLSIELISNPTYVNYGESYRKKGNDGGSFSELDRNFSLIYDDGIMVANSRQKVSDLSPAKKNPVNAFRFSYYSHRGSTSDKSKLNLKSTNNVNEKEAAIVRKKYCKEISSLSGTMHESLSPNSQKDVFRPFLWKSRGISENMVIRELTKYRVRAISTRRKGYIRVPTKTSSGKHYFRVRASSEKYIKPDDIKKRSLEAEHKNKNKSIVAKGGEGDGSIKTHHVKTSFIDPNIWKYILMFHSVPLSAKKPGKDITDIKELPDVSNRSVLDLFRSVDRSAVIIQKDFYTREKIMKKIKEEENTVKKRHTSVIDKTVKASQADPDISAKSTVDGIVCHENLLPSTAGSSDYASTNEPNNNAEATFSVNASSISKSSDEFKFLRYDVMFSKAFDSAATEYNLDIDGEVNGKLAKEENLPSYSSENKGLHSLGQRYDQSFNKIRNIYKNAVIFDSTDNNKFGASLDQNNLIKDVSEVTSRANSDQTSEINLSTNTDQNKPVNVLPSIPNHVNDNTISASMDNKTSVDNSSVKANESTVIDQNKSIDAVSISHYHVNDKGFGANTDQRTLVDTSSTSPPHANKNAAIDGNKLVDVNSEPSSHVDENHLRTNEEINKSVITTDKTSSLGSGVPTLPATFTSNLSSGDRDIVTRFSASPRLDIISQPKTSKNDILETSSKPEATHSIEASEPNHLDEDGLISEPVLPLHHNFSDEFKRYQKLSSKEINIRDPNFFDYNSFRVEIVKNSLDKTKDGNLLIKLKEDGCDSLDISSYEVSFYKNPEKGFSVAAAGDPLDVDIAALVKDNDSENTKEVTTKTGSDLPMKDSIIVKDTHKPSSSFPLPESTSTTSINLRTFDNKTELSVAQNSNTVEPGSPVPSVVKSYFQMSGCSAKLREQAGIVDTAKKNLMGLGGVGDLVPISKVTGKTSLLNICAGDTASNTINVSSGAYTVVGSKKDGEINATNAKREYELSSTAYADDLQPIVSVTNDYPVINIQLQLAGKGLKSTTQKNPNQEEARGKVVPPQSDSYEDTIDKMRKKFISNTFRPDSSIAVNRLKPKSDENKTLKTLSESEKEAEEKKPKIDNFEYDPNSNPLNEKDLKLLENYFYSKNNPNKKGASSKVKKSSKYSLGKGKGMAAKKVKLDSSSHVIDSVTKFKELIEKYANENYMELSQYTFSVVSPSEFANLAKISSLNKVTPINDVSDEAITSFSILKKDDVFSGFEKPLEGIINIDLLANPLLKEKYAAVPSVSRILNDTMSDISRAALEKWKTRMIETMGEPTFQEFYQAQLDQGKDFHESVKGQLMGRSDLSEKHKGNLCLKSVDWVLKDVTDVAAVESFVLHPSLGYKGIFDCVAKYKDKAVLIEWKHSNKRKSRLSSTYDAPLQMTAYMGALSQDKNYNFQVDSGLVVVAHADGSPAELFEVNVDDCQKFWTLWLKRLSLYISNYRQKSPTI